MKYSDIHNSQLNEEKQTTYPSSFRKQKTKKKKKKEEHIPKDSRRNWIIK